MAAAWKREWMEITAVTQAGTFQLQVPGSCSEPRWAWLLRGFFLGGDGGWRGQVGTRRGARPRPRADSNEKQEELWSHTAGDLSSHPQGSAW